MRRIPFICFALALLASFAARGGDFIDRIDEVLSVSGFHEVVRARLSGTMDLEAYSFSEPPLGLIQSGGSTLFNPRLTVFLDTQIGGNLYAFVQARWDRGFDPSNDRLDVRIDEYALRFTPWEDGRFNVQVGQFAALVGNWIPRHGSWDNAFITAPLPYENLTGIWDSTGAGSVNELLGWAHVFRPNPSSSGPSDKYLRKPIIWGPDYTSGVAVFGKVGPVTYSAELKNGSLSSRPEAWSVTRVQWQNPTYTARLSYAPNPMWAIGLSASTGSYLLPLAARNIPSGHSLSDYRETVVAQDVSFAWHHFQFWAECYEARFNIPLVANVETVAYYLETKYRFTPQFFAALRWNEQLFSSVTNRAGLRSPWGRDAWRIDLAPGYRFTPHTQLKFQYSLQHENSGPPRISRLLATQLTVRF